MANKLIDEKEVFNRARRIAAPERRTAYLQEACNHDPAAMQRILELIRVHEQEASFLESSPVVREVTIDEPVAERPGTVIGPYKLLEQIGEGGFGVVFMAEQQHPVRRNVALKVLKPGMDTRQVVARFEAERQALALMDYPYIARVLDAGATDTGRPYFVMELVRGIAITQFCDDNQLPIPERLELFVAVCQAVQHAHQKGIIHRDLKPSNVLVTLHDGTPLVKVIDFGIAKALGQERLTDKTLFTGFAQLLGTPLYMSPEQAELSGQDADTRTDIYALGVLLYELLTGTTPFDRDRLKEASYDEIRRIIREEEPAKPSTRITTLGQAATTASANRKSEARRLSQLLRGELDWIVMKALEKDRNRRYESASSFAADVQRYLHDEPVQACPPSAGYRFRKFARRNRAALVTALAVGLAVLVAVVGLVTSTVLIAREQQATTNALQAETEARADLEQALERERQNSYYQRIALADREWSANNLARVEQLLDACPADLRSWEWHYLKRLRLQSIPPLSHPDAVYCATFSPEGRWLASGSQDGKVRVWDAHSGQVWFSFPAHESAVWSVAISPDGRLLATAGWDKTVKLWVFDPLRTAGVPPLIRILPHPARVHSVAFSPDSQHLASAGDDKTVRVWEAVTCRQIFFLTGHTSGIWRVAYSPDGQFLASASADTTVKIWEARTGRELRTLSGHNQPVFCVTFSRDVKQMASATIDFDTMSDSEMKVWEVQTGRETLSLRGNGGHVGWVTSVAFSADGRRLASAGVDCNVKLWDLKTGHEVLTLRGHSVMVHSLAFSRDGNQLASASGDSVRIWNATPLEGEGRQEVLTLRGHDGGVRSVAFSPDGRHLASAGDDAAVRFWDFRRGLAGDPDALIQTLSGGKAMHVNVAFSKDGQLLASGGRGGSLDDHLKVWDASTWKEVEVPNVGSPVAFSPDGHHFAGAGVNCTIEIWEIQDAAPGRKIHTLTGHSWAIGALAFSPDPGFVRLASASGDRTVRVWDVTASRDIVPHRVSGASRVALGASLLGAGSFFAATALGAGQFELVALLRHTHDVRCLAFSPDGRSLASGGGDRTVRVWNARTWQMVHELPDPTGRVRSLAFHPKDDRVLAWGSTDSTVKIVKIPDGTSKEIRTLHGHKSWVESVAFSPDGKWIASASLDGTVKLWQGSLVPEAPAPAAKAARPREGQNND